MTTAYILSDNNLVAFDVTNPDRPNPPVPISGIATGEQLVGIDIRPQTGKLYGLTSSAAGVRLYVISPQSGVATPLTAAPVQFDDGSNPVPIQGVNFGFDFNPTVDRIRVVTDAGENFRLNPNTGALVDGNNGSPTAVAGINSDGSVKAATTRVDGAAYTNSSPDVSTTTQYTLDASSNQLFIQNPPNSGTQTAPLPITFNGSPLDFSAVNGFDIPASVTVATSNQPAQGQGYATLTVGGSTGLYAINLATGAATLIGPVGSAGAATQGLALQSDLNQGTPLIGLSSDSLSGNSLLRFNSANPTVTTTVAITGVPAGETLVGIDFRPATGQLFGLSVNDSSNTGSLLILDPQLGTATPVGTAGQIALVDAAGNPVDLPGTGFGFDFNPTVDRIRVVTSSGLNFRLNPLTGAAVDGDNGGAAGSVAGINPDGAIKGSTTSTDATAYTNSFSQTGTPVTTQYTLDATTNSLLIQNPPNSGTQTAPLAITLNGAALDFDAVSGFDIPDNVQVASANAPASGRAFAALSVGGTTSLYGIELSTGAATLLGAVGAGTAALSGLAAGTAPTGGVAFGAATYSASETGKTIALNLLRTGGTAGALTVNLTATGGTATADDYSGLPLSVTFADGQTSATASLAIIDDNLLEGDETLILGLSNPSNGGVLAAQDTATLTITDNEQRQRGTGGNDRLLGAEGSDLLLGLGGNDRLLGRAGDDSLTGGRGRDRLRGDAGADRFIYTGRSQRGALSQSLLRSSDRILDFNPTEGDRIQLDFDKDLTTRNRPRQLFNAGEQRGSLTDAVEDAYADKDQRRNGSQQLKANEAVFFTRGARTYLAVNDQQADFAVNRDLIVNVTGLQMNMGDLNAGKIAVARYFI
ncbi:MAG: DUF4394 domain-containing protein [Pegethrix bostrychoides GSE-TBD4-15B]|jgi:hypothetical protein|uniref:DUF4394 domain-containing protein n=1 Tax=Pegethrix bostrychoides GSE-TBD4-15B TaxID=2839662 RepID=A0A951P772_9CYAN|nr:DUF4394 domain-containing protein [Pegethrix bostrychoides GSE-TBD4-15B]